MKGVGTSGVGGTGASGLRGSVRRGGGHRCGPGGRRSWGDRSVGERSRAAGCQSLGVGTTPVLTHLRSPGCHPPVPHTRGAPFRSGGERGGCDGEDLGTRDGRAPRSETSGQPTRTVRTGHPRPHWGCTIESDSKVPRVGKGGVVVHVGPTRATGPNGDVRRRWVRRKDVPAHRSHRSCIPHRETGVGTGASREVLRRTIHRFTWGGP